MTVIRIDPIRELENLSQKMKQWADEATKGVNFEFGSFSPRIDVYENDDYVFVVAETPGIAKEDIKLSISENGILKIKGEKKKKAEKEAIYLRNEIASGKFEREVALPEEIDASEVEATYENGLLKAKIAKKKKEETKNFEIKIK